MKSGKVTGDENIIIYPTFHMLVVSTFSRIEEMRKRKLSSRDDLLLLFEA